MPKGPKRQKRPADVIGAAVEVMRIAAGQQLRQYVIEKGKLPKPDKPKGRGMP